MALTILQILPAFGSGGAEQATLELAAALTARGDRALIVTKGGWRCEAAQKAGAELILRDVASKNPAKILRNALWLARLIRAEKVAVVHARSRAPAWSAKLACRLTGCPFVTTFHAAYKFSNAAKRAYNSVMAAGERVIAISPFIGNHIRQNYGVSDARLRVIDRGIDVDSFNPEALAPARLDALRSAWGLGAEEKVILLPARLSRIKGHEVALQALKLLREQGKVLPPTLFVGEAQGRHNYRAALEETIAAYGLKESVKCVGACADMAAAYALSALVLQPSQVPEGFGRVPVEAMAMGVPVIASDLGGMKDTILQGVTGWLVPPEDPAAWAAALIEADSLNALQRKTMALASRERVIARFTSTRMIAQTLAVYEDVVGHERKLTNHPPLAGGSKLRSNFGEGSSNVEER